MIFSCIDRALRSLGDSVAASFFYQIERKSGLPREEFATKPLEIIKCLEELLGVAGSKIIERLIVQEIRNTFNLPSSNATTLEVAIKAAKKNFLLS